MNDIIKKNIKKYKYLKMSEKYYTHWKNSAGTFIMFVYLQALSAAQRQGVAIDTEKKCKCVFSYS